MHVLAVGASAGGVEALSDLAAGLPADLPAAVLVTIHIGAHARTKLPEILSRVGPLPARHARHGESLQTGRIYVAPPGYHLLTAQGRVELSSGPTVNRHRPAVDAMFAAAARWADGHLVAAVLSGMLDDGAVGAALVARAGGRVLVQEPHEAIFASMPRAAMAAVPQAHVVAAREIGPVVQKLATEVCTHRPPTEGAHGMERRSMAGSGDPLYLAEQESRLTRLTCPDCGGGLAQVDLSGIVYYRCHVGHQYGPRTLVDAQGSDAERKLWSAVAALEEHAALAGHLADSHREDQEAYRQAAERAAEMAQSLRERLTDPNEQNRLDDEA